MKQRTTSNHDHATFMEEAARRSSGHQLAVHHARKHGRPLYHVRHRIGTTLDLCVTPQEARKVRDRAGAGAEMLELRADGGAYRMAS